MRLVPRLSIPRRIFLGLALVFVASASVLSVSVVQHERTAKALTLLDRDYLPLALTVSEARATQTVVNTLLDRLLNERDTTSPRMWLQAARQRRPRMLEQVRSKVDQIHALVPWETEGAALLRLLSVLRHVQSRINHGERRYADLYAVLDSGDRASAERIIADLRVNERSIDNDWRRIWEELVARIEVTSRRVAAQEDQAVVVLIALAGVAMLVGIVVTWWSQRVLSPLPRLQERVAAVARGELSDKLEPITQSTEDEIGRLAQEFERMVKALVAREGSLREAQARLLQSERLAAIGRMAAHVSHEVRNPLSSIGLNVELLEEELRSANPETRELLRAVRREIDRLGALTEEYLRVARLPNPHLLPEHVNDVVRGAVQLLRLELAAASVLVELELDEDLPLVAMDEAQMRQVLINLLKNAREAMPQGGVVHIAAHACPDGVELSIRDTGVGMDAEQKERIFDLFYTTKQRGSGLGLPLTQQIVVAHGGHIRCESSPGRGTEFKLFLPVARVTERVLEDALVAED